jgi:hypothetical protein
LPFFTSLAALATRLGVAKFSVPIWSSLPQRPQFESFLLAAWMAFLPTLIFVFPPNFLYAHRALEIDAVGALERQNIARFIRRCRLKTQTFDDLTNLSDLRGIRFSQFSRSEPK